MANINLRRFTIESMTDPKFVDFPAGYYYGETINGKRHGAGMFFWPGGESYMGSWANDMRNGFGVFRDSNGGMMIGTWMNRRLVGWGAEFDYMSPQIKFVLPEDEDLRDAMGTSLVESHKEWIMDSDGDFGPVFEGFFRGQFPDGYGLRYTRDRETGVVTEWTIGEHTKRGDLDGFGIKHQGTHPEFSFDNTQVEMVYSVQGTFCHDELQPGTGRVVTSYWMGTTCIQAIEANGYINEHGFIDGPVNVVLDGKTLWSGVIEADNERDPENQLKNILASSSRESRVASMLIDDQRLDTEAKILSGDEDRADLDSSYAVPGFADMTPANSWIFDIMIKQSENMSGIKKARGAEQDRFDEGNLEYDRRCFIIDEDGDVAHRMDTVDVSEGELMMDFEIPFTPTVTTSLTTDDEGEPKALVHIMFGNKVVGMFSYNNTKLTVKTGDMRFESVEKAYGEGTRVMIPVSDGGEDFEYNLDVSSCWCDNRDYPNDVVTREMLGFDDDDNGDDDDNNDPEGMDVERDEDGNVTGMGFSMTGNNPDQESQNMNTLLNVFKNGGHFAPIDEIMEDAKKSK
jgi:hypothetical protein